MPLHILFDSDLLMSSHNIQDTSGIAMYSVFAVYHGLPLKIMTFYIAHVCISDFVSRPPLVPQGSNPILAHERNCRLERDFLSILLFLGHVIGRRRNSLSIDARFELFAVVMVVIVNQYLEKTFKVSSLNVLSRYWFTITTITRANIVQNARLDKLHNNYAQIQSYD